MSETASPPLAEVPGLAAALRVRQAARTDAPRARLQAFARDRDLLVRATVAINASCGPDIDCILAADTDERIRALLAGRIARLLPSLDDRAASDAVLHVHRTLAGLARDEAIRVRAAVAAEIKGMDAAPRDLVLVLAQDGAAEVSDPVVRLSPVLTDADLLALLATPPFATAARSIASRPKLSATVADAIVAHTDVPAIRALLCNQSACIRESTLDALIGRAPDHAEWHAPLISRPGLSDRAIRALSEFIAADLLRILASRVDLDPSRLEVVRQRLAMEIGERDDVSLMADAQHLKDRGALAESTLLDAARIGDTRLLAALLAVASGVALAVVDQAVELRSPKALVTLVHRAGLSMRTAMAVQIVVAQLGPDNILGATADGDFPLSPDEMEWQMELMTGPELIARGGGPNWSGQAGHSA